MIALKKSAWAYTAGVLVIAFGGLYLLEGPPLKRLEDRDRKFIEQRFGSQQASADLTEARVRVIVQEEVKGLRQEFNGMKEDIQDLKVLMQKQGELMQKQGADIQRLLSRDATVPPANGPRPQ